MTDNKVSEEMLRIISEEMLPIVSEELEKLNARKLSDWVKLCHIKPARMELPDDDAFDAIRKYMDKSNGKNYYYSVYKEILYYIKEKQLCKKTNVNFFKKDGELNHSQFGDYAHLDHDTLGNMKKHDENKKSYDPDDVTVRRLCIALRLSEEEAIEFAYKNHKGFDYKSFGDQLILACLNCGFYDPRFYVPDFVNGILYYFQQLEDPFFDNIYDKKSERREKREEYEARQQKEQDENFEKMRKDKS